MPALPLVSRRAALAAAALGGAAVTVGCDLDGLVPGAGPDPDQHDPATAPRPDEAVVAAAAEEVAAVLGLVAATGRRHPRLRPALGGLERLHRAHADALGVASGGPDDRPGGAPKGRRRARETAALERTRRRELAHQRRLADLAVEADAGRLAQLLGSMSAGVAQHVAVLDVEPPA